MANIPNSPALCGGVVGVYSSKNYPKLAQNEDFLLFLKKYLDNKLY